MPRRPREKSSTNIYHCMLRGINKQNIFHDAEDKTRLIEILIHYKNICEYEIYGYCLMDNHIHLLIKEGKESVSQAIKRVGVSYVYWYNLKYERNGHLFQDRFKSEKIEDDKYLLTALRYIHQNPVKAGIVTDASKYKWSSYPEYINQKGDVTDIEFILGILDSDPDKAVKVFEEFMMAENEDDCLDVNNKIRKHLSDEQARKQIRKLSNSDNVLILQQMNKNERDDIIKELKKTGFSIRQLVRITGLGKRIIERA